MRAAVDGSITDRGSLACAAAATATAAVLGNPFVGKEALGWFRSLRRPRGMPTMPVFMAIGAGYYLLMATVVYRCLQRGNRRGVRRTLLVLVLNELWNVAFFGRRSTRNGFAGTVVFTVPLAALGAAVRGDRQSTTLVEAYGALVLYDLWWTYGLWRLNSGAGSPTVAGVGG